MGLIRTLHLTPCGAHPCALLWVLLSLLFPVFCDVPQTMEEMKGLHFEEGVVEAENTIERLTGLGIGGVTSASKAVTMSSSFPQCVKLGESEPLALQSDGDVVIGGLFPLHYVAHKPHHSYHSKPQQPACSG